ncbi:alpha-galactosidase [Nakamurella sp. UYEF19]|uniref:alpha-galactosidase n=1 Tax=Nakamurella sp. UYEF19 TaxID=1756392 RepID=UPI00339ACC0E
MTAVSKAGGFAVDGSSGGAPTQDPAGNLVHLRREGVSVLIDARGPGQPVVLHWGADLTELSPSTLSSLARAMVPAVPRAVTDEPLPRGLLPETAGGYRGRPGLSGHRAGGSAPTLLQLASVQIDGKTLSAGDPGSGASVEFELVDEAAGLSVRSWWSLRVSGLLEVRHQVTNTGQSAYELRELAVVLPVPQQALELMDFTGRWCRERAPQRRPFVMGAVTRENRRGRTAADSAFLTIAGSPGFGNRHGSVWATHLAWSGDQITWAEAQPDGTRMLGAAELLSPGEIELAPGESYATPTVFGAFSSAGLDGVSDRFHTYQRSLASHPSSPRPAVLNTWEAVYFDHDLARLNDLADQAAALGIERFVLDDGWFGGRRDDTTSLGDWDVSSEVWPDGLGPLVSHVTGLGMQFGLWVEPEMINLDSDLYRAHPDWLLAPPGVIPAQARQQQVLDVANSSARQYLFAKIDGLVKEYGISFLKWDHNRDLVNPMHQGRPGAHAQTLAVYRLMDDLKAANPSLEIESCASGGARVDLGILARTDRVWASDCNDALERQHIQRWTGLLLPPELIGAHVGPATSHTTGRTQGLAFRAATALFQHFGAEWDISAASPSDRAALGAVIAAYRRLRPLLHTGTVVNADHPDPAATVSGVVAKDGSAAVFSYAQLTSGVGEGPVPMRFPGLDPDRDYTVTVLDPTGETGFVHREPPLWMADGSVTLSGRILETVGLAVPVLHPEQALLLELTAR